MAEFEDIKEKIVDIGEPIAFENKTDSDFDVSTGIVFRRSGIYEVLILGNRTVVSKVTERKTGKWILCSETADLPEREVLCCDRYGAELIGWLSYSDDQWLCESDGATMYDPIAWCEKPESQWIPCSITTNLPDHEVLCCDLRGNMLIGYLYTDESSDTGFGAESDGECLVDCVAWREKPEPWGGDAE